MPKTTKTKEMPNENKCKYCGGVKTKLIQHLSCELVAIAEKDLHFDLNNVHYSRSKANNENKQCCPKCNLVGNAGKIFHDNNCPCHQEKSTPTELWEEGFDKLWEEESGVAMPEITKPFKSFISSLLANKIDLEEVVRMIEEEIRPLKHQECTNGQHEMCETCSTRNVVNARLLSLRQKLLDRAKIQ